MGKCREARLYDTTVYYAVGKVSRLDELLREAGDDAILVPTRLAASVVHAVQAAVLAWRNWSRGVSRAKRAALEALLYLLAARGADPVHTSLSRVAGEGPREGETVVLVARDPVLCEKLAARLGEAEGVEWLEVREEIALTRTALAAGEVERRRLQRLEETA